MESLTTHILKGESNHIILKGESDNIYSEGSNHIYSKGRV